MITSPSNDDSTSSSKESLLVGVKEEENSLSESTCPGEAASHRLALFEESWSSIASDSISINDVDKVVENDLSITRRLGSGSFSDVYIATPKQAADGVETTSEQIFAIKRPSAKVIANRSALHTYAGDLAFEAALLANLKHENIIAIHGVKDGNIVELMKEGKFFIALDLLVETLDRRLKRWKTEKKRGVFQKGATSDFIQTRLKGVAIGIVNGMEYLHSKKILYRDLKPANIGFDDLRDQVKIFDFGLSRFHTEDESKLMTGICGSPRYMAPELIGSIEASYSYPIDVYSFSLLLWQILCDRSPFDNYSASVKKLQEKVLGGKRPALKYIQDQKIRQLIAAGWSSNPADRPSFTYIQKVLNDIIEENITLLAAKGGNNEEIAQIKNDQSDCDVANARRPERRMSTPNSLLIKSLKTDVKAPADDSEQGAKDGSPTPSKLNATTIQQQARSGRAMLATMRLRRLMRKNPPLPGIGESECSDGIGRHPMGRHSTGSLWMARRSEESCTKNAEWD